MRAGGRGVLGVSYLLENIITANLKGGKTAVKEDSPPSPPLENTLYMYVCVLQAHAVRD